MPPKARRIRSAEAPPAEPRKDPNFDNGMRVRRRRRNWAPGDREKRDAIAKRVIEFYERDREARSGEAEKRLQRYAMMRMWTEGKDWPWEGASDAAIPDIAMHVLRTEDTLVNAVMSAQPPVVAKGKSEPMKDRAETVDRLIAHQIFTEMPGREIIGELAHNFTHEGVMTAFVPWVTERKKTVDVRIFPPLPPASLPPQVFQAYLAKCYPDAQAAPKGGEGWDWIVQRPNEPPATASFYTRENDEIEMMVEQDVVAYDGPAIIVKPWEEVLFWPPMAKNLQRPGPANPRGAAHVILVDNDVTIDEIQRLQKSGYYDLIDAEEVKNLEIREKDDTRAEAKRQKEAIQGVNSKAAQMPKGAEAHKTLTRLVCFDVYDIDGDGIAEDVMWWVILETRQLVRARIMTEMYPSNPPRRPLMRQEFMPDGIGLPELLEGLHVLTKQVIDQAVDAATITTIPFGFYRAAGGMRPEVIRMWPGEMYPLADPKNDVAFPTINNQASAFSLNFATLFGQWEERLAMQGELQFGRVPQGRSSALRTLGGMQSVMSQGEARPERILGRFFTGLAEIWAQIHELNQRYLPEKKVVRLLGMQRRGQEAYTAIAKREDIAGRFDFEFAANAFNTSRQALQQALGKLFAVLPTPLMLQLGIVKPDGIFRFAQDVVQAEGLDPHRYLSPPDPSAWKPRVLAEDVLIAIMNGQTPYGAPAEAGGWQEHLTKLAEFMQSDEFGHITDPQQVERLKGWIQEGATEMLYQAKQQQLMAAAAAQQQGGGGQGGPAGIPVDPVAAQQPPQVSGPGELIDETLPGAGGGANTGAMQ